MITLPDVCHGKGKLEFGRGMCRDANLDGPSPLCNYFVQPHFKQLVRFQRSGCQHHSVIKVVEGTERNKKKSLLQLLNFWNINCTVGSKLGEKIFKLGNNNELAEYFKFLFEIYFGL